MSSFPDSFDEIGAASYGSDSTRPFDGEDGYAPPSVYSNSVEESVDDSVIFSNTSDGVFSSNLAPPIYGFESNGDPATNGVFAESDGPILPPPSEMQEEGFALREWRRQNANLLEQKEKREKEILSQIIEEAYEYKAAFHEKRKGTCETNKNNNREKEKLFLTNQEKFHKEADINYWKAIAELIPNEVPALEKKRGKKDQEKKVSSITVIQGPKPGKPTDLVRMRQILVKLKHTTPAHLNLTPPAKDVKAGGSAAELPKPAVTVAANPEAVVAAS